MNSFLKWLVISVLPVMAPSALAEGFVAFDCIIELPRCYTLDTRNLKKGSPVTYEFKCFDGPFAQVNYHTTLDEFFGLEDWAIVKELGPIGRFRLQEVVSRDPPDLTTLVLTDEVRALSFLGEAKSLVESIVKNCEQNPFGRIE